jgi:hypothetical protein
MWALKTSWGISSTKQRLPAMTSALTAVAGEDGHHAEDIAGAELAEDRAGAGVVGDGDLGVAGDHHADHAAFVAGFEDGLVAFVGGQPGLVDDVVDLVGREAARTGAPVRGRIF